MSEVRAVVEPESMMLHLGEADYYRDGWYYDGSIPAGRIHYCLGRPQAASLRYSRLQACATGCATGQAEGKMVSMQYACPCGCGNIGHIPINKEFDAKAWDWNGSQEAPTLLPSVRKLTPCGWHGYLTNGIWKPC